jgi:hypothetical protein
MPIHVPGHRDALPDGDRRIVESVESVVRPNDEPVSSWRRKRRPIAPTSSNSTLQQYTQPGDQIRGPCGSSRRGRDRHLHRRQPGSKRNPVSLSMPPSVFGASSSLD